MTNIDQFESVFRSADKVRFVLEDVTFRRLLVVTDLEHQAANEFVDSIQAFLPALKGEQLQWQVMTHADNPSISHLIATIEQTRPDLICTYRNLHLPATDHPYSLGVHLDVMTQATTQPVLVLPSPLRVGSTSFRTASNVVMAITDHLSDQRHLVSVAARCTSPHGRLLLAHIEDEAVFERYLQTISKIPEIDTDIAKTTILDQLLKEATDYIKSCREELNRTGATFSVDSIVTMGHRLKDYCELIRKHGVSLLVLNTKDKDQLAMHGLAYPLSVELRDIALMLL